MYLFVIFVAWHKINIENYVKHLISIDYAMQLEPINIKTVRRVSNLERKPEPHGSTWILGVMVGTFGLYSTHFDRLLFRNDKQTNWHEENTKMVLDEKEMRRWMKLNLFV